MVRIVNTILLIIAFLLTLSGSGLANQEMEEPVEAIQGSMSKRLIEAKERSLTKGRITESIRGEAEDFDGEQKLQEFIERADETGQSIWLMAQAQTWPLFMYGITGGLVLVISGIILKWNALKRIGVSLGLVACIQLILINYAPEFAVSIVSWVGKLF